MLVKSAKTRLNLSLIRSFRELLIALLMRSVLNMTLSRKAILRYSGCHTITSGELSGHC